MRIRFLGAAGDVTGSAYHVMTNDAGILVDCGFFQGRRQESAKNRRTKQIEDGKLDAVVLTHGHLDHIGRLPLLTRNGYKGPVYATRPTLDLATLILKDSLGLQKQDLKRQNKKRAQQKLTPLPALFEEADVRKLKSLVNPVKYNQRFEVARGIEARLVDAGHVIGSARLN
jgi:metallo-beta-lactamase family protein